MPQKRQTYFEFSDWRSDFCHFYQAWVQFGCDKEQLVTVGHLLKTSDIWQPTSLGTSIINVNTVDIYLCQIRPYDGSENKFWQEGLGH